ncbi:UNVERIFIED_ORG: glutaredoxin [Ensifer adhaerens]|nr:glutaredoxin [Ensifer adhaerens]
MRMNGPTTIQDPKVTKLTCPHCRHAGAFYAPSTKDVYWEETEGSGSDRTDANYLVGIRRCPSPDCNGVVFIGKRDGKLAETFPPTTVDFDTTNLPEDILSSFEQAVKSHSIGCFKASALMVRRVLEELCKDKGATGKNLKEQIKQLSGTIIVPTVLLTAADELRILGNDAAHIKAKDYDEIGKEEVELAIELTKELLKAVYQYDSLLGRLQALKKPVEKSDAT